ncbi:hypothetical protein J655_3590 [Acinetobacter sp. 1294243]|nr:hypothetical protein J655_3590 [Acinetobacter sp. 1294243]
MDLPRTRTTKEQYKLAQQVLFILNIANYTQKKIVIDEITIFLVKRK